MNILTICGLYPPHYVGGYELGCRDVMDGLRERGHRVNVLTSTYGVEQPVQEGHVYRWLLHDRAFRFDAPVGDRLRMVEKEVHNRRAFARLVRATRPDVIYAWAMTHISLSVLQMAQTMGVPVYYFASDDWLSRWERIDRWQQLPPAGAKRWSKRALNVLVEKVGGDTGGAPLDLSHVQFCSAFLKHQASERGKPVERARVIHWGVDTQRFRPSDAPNEATGRLLFVGQVAKVKGVHTAIEAFRLLADRFPTATLTIAGGSIFPDYVARIERQVRDAGLGGRVGFAGLVVREELPALYRAHDVLIFPSEWNEPFSITLLEALASGLAVVGTTTGGSAEILRDGDNALTFAAGDAAMCAAQVARLLEAPLLAVRLREAARRTVERGFTLGGMVDAIERDLLDRRVPETEQV